MMLSVIENCFDIGMVWGKEIYSMLMFLFDTLKLDPFPSFKFLYFCSFTREVVFFVNIKFIWLLEIGSS